MLQKHQFSTVVMGSVLESVDMSDLTGQSVLNNICLGDCRDERRTTSARSSLGYYNLRTPASSYLTHHQYEFYMYSHVNHYYLLISVS